MHVSLLFSPPAQNLGSSGNTAGLSALADISVTVSHTRSGAIGNATLMRTSVGSPPLSKNN